MRSEIAKRFDWPNNVDENFKYENGFIIKSNESLVENKIKNCCENKTMKTIFMSTEHSETNEPYKFVLKLSQRLDLRNSNKHVAFEDLSIFHTWRSLRKQYKNNKLEIIAPTWNEVLELPHGSYSVSNIQDYLQYIIKKQETLTVILLIHVYINRINTLWEKSTKLWSSWSSFSPNEFSEIVK